MALENAFLAGVLSIVSTGNQANKPYTIATTAESPNSLAVAATGEAGDLYQNRGSVEFYSSRGPGANNAIKPVRTFFEFSHESNGIEDAAHLIIFVCI